MTCHRGEVFVSAEISRSHLARLDDNRNMTVFLFKKETCLDFVTRCQIAFIC